MKIQKSARRTAAGIIALVTLCSATCVSAVYGGTQAKAAATLTGDVNGDGSVTTADVDALTQVLEGNANLSADEAANADVNTDGMTNGLDLALLRGMVAADPVEDTIYIHLNNGAPYVDGDTKGVTSVSGKTVTITASGTYYVDGTITDGQILVNIADTTADAESVDLFLNGVNMTSTTGAPCINAQSADKVKITTTADTVLSDTATTANADTSGVIYAACDLTFTKNSTASLTVNSIMNIGIYSKDDIKFNGGTINVDTDTEDTADADAIKAKNSITVDGATLDIDSSADGIKSTKDDVTVNSGSVTVKAGNDAIQASTLIAVAGGTVIAGGDRGFTLDDAGKLTITGGTVLATSTDYAFGNSGTATVDTSTTTQSTMILSYTDVHAKSETFKVNNTSLTAAKKYQYVLYSDASIASSNSVYAGDVQMIHDGDTTNGVFQTSGTVSSYTGVQAKGGSSSTTPSTDATGAAASLVYSSSSVKAYDASGAELSNPTNVTISGATATITSASVDEIAVSGTSTSGQLIVDIPDSGAAITLSLQGLTLSNSTAAPIYVKSCDDECSISVKNGTTNTISDGTSHTDTEDDGTAIAAAIFSKEDLKIKGNGTLIVNANTADGIVSKDTLKLWNGNIQVNAVDDCIRGKDAVKIGDPDDTDYSNLVITAKSTGGDGIKATNSTDTGKGGVTINGGTVTVTAYSDGIQGEQDVTINGGTLDITTTATSTNDNSAKGIKSVGVYDSAGTTLQSGGTITVNGGNITINSKDDSIHSAGNTTLNAGKIKITSGDDAVHSDSSLYVGGTTAGTDYTSLEVYVTACYEGFEAAYIYQNNGNIYIISSDDGFNAAGGSDSSGNSSSSGGWNQGGWNMGGGGMGGSSSYGEMYLNGGVVSVNTSFNDADGFDSNGPVVFNGGYYFGNGGDSFDCGDSSSITYNGGYAFGGLGMNGGGGSSYDMSTQMVFTTSDGTVLASSMSGSSMTYAYGDSSVLAYSGAQISGGTNISTLGEPAVYVSGTASGGTSKTLGSSSSGGQTGPGGQSGQGGFNW